MKVLFVNANSKPLYQKLSDKFSAIEPPTWALLLAQSLRTTQNVKTSILDAEALELQNDEIVHLIDTIYKPDYIVFAVYGQNPNSGTTNMGPATKLAKYLKEHSNNNAKIVFIGSHISALPKETLENHPEIDFGSINEGVYTLHDLLQASPSEYHKVRGLVYRDENKVMVNNGEVVPTHKMDIELPGYAWDLLPYKERPLDLYRSHFWHTNFNHALRQPFAALYTSLGCQFKCEFCMVNIINRINNGLNTVSSDSNIMRFWSPEFIIQEFDKLIKMGVHTIRLSDEMFYLNKKYYEPLLKLIKDRGYGEHIRLWSYSRVDTVNERFLDTFREGGIKYLALGIEAGNQTVRKEITKGSFKDVNIREVVKTIHNHGINVIANYIFGLPDDTLETMKETLNLGIELNTEMWNGYCAQALPGSPLYYQAKEKGWKLPESYEGYGFLSYDCVPLPTKYLEAKDVLSFRDRAFHQYFDRPEYLQMIEQKFGVEAKKNIQELTSVKIKRKLLDDSINNNAS